MKALPLFHPNGSDDRASVNCIFNLFGKRGHNLGRDCTSQNLKRSDTAGEIPLEGIKHLIQRELFAPNKKSTYQTSNHKPQ
jgi:hypothetical protein